MLRIVPLPVSCRRYIALQAGLLTNRHHEPRGAKPLSTPVSTWVLLGDKAGDNTQMLALANALTRAPAVHVPISDVRMHTSIHTQAGHTPAAAASSRAFTPFSARKLSFRNTELLTNLLLRVTLAGLNPATSDVLEPPWPDLIITAGRRNEPVARWVQSAAEKVQSAAGNAQRAAGTRTRLVHIGRPWANPALFDLIVTTPQYQVPPAANVLCVDLPLVEPASARVAAAAEEWRPRLAALPRPWVAVLIGGDSGAARFTMARARALGVSLRKEVADGGSLLVTTSSRSGSGAVAALRDRLPTPHHFFDWHQQPRAENPYLGYLALADRFVVTAESASMLAEACATGKPVAMFDLRAPPYERFESWRWAPLTYSLAQRFAPPRLRRDIRRIHQQLIDSGRACWLGTPWLGTPQLGTPQLADPWPGTAPPAWAAMASLDTDLHRAVARVQALF